MSILTDEKINEIAKNVCDLSEKESNTDTLKRLRKLLKENETAPENLIKSIEAGEASTIISSQIEKRQLEKQNLEAQIAREKILKPKLQFEQVDYSVSRSAVSSISFINSLEFLIISSLF